MSEMESLHEGGDNEIIFKEDEPSPTPHNQGMGGKIREDESMS